MEEKLKKRIGKSIPNELIYNIVDDLNDIKKIKNEIKKKQALKEILNELEESSSIADDAYNTTKSDAKKIKINLFKEYNKARQELVNDYIKTGTYNSVINFKLTNEKITNKKITTTTTTSGKKECPETKILNTTGRCVNKTGAIGKKLLKTLSTNKSSISVEVPVSVPVSVATSSKINEDEDEKLKKKLPSYISPEFVYNIDKIVNFIINDKSYSLNTKIEELKNMLNDLNDIDYEVSTDASTRTKKQQEKINVFLKYNKKRIDKVSFVLNNLILKKGDVMNPKKK
jgi:hypothetical protein